MIAPIWIRISPWRLPVVFARRTDSPKVASVIRPASSKRRPSASRARFERTASGWPPSSTTTFFRLPDSKCTAPVTLVRMALQSTSIAGSFTRSIASTGPAGSGAVGLPICRETWSIRRAGSIGFSRKAFAPAVSAVRITSAPRNTPLMAISGIPRVASAACSTAITELPSFLGSSRSINTRSGRAFATASSAAFPS